MKRARTMKPRPYHKDTTRVGFAVTDAARIEPLNEITAGVDNDQRTGRTVHLTKLEMRLCYNLKTLGGPQDLEYTINADTTGTLTLTATDATQPTWGGSISGTRSTTGTMTVTIPAQWEVYDCIRVLIIWDKQSNQSTLVLDDIWEFLEPASGLLRWDTTMERLEVLYDKTIALASPEGPRMKTIEEIINLDKYCVFGSTLGTTGHINTGTLYFVTRGSYPISTTPSLYTGSFRVYYEH